ncbi:hypothetical protein DBR33_18940 [Stenotrophomonas sp. HMWF022]|nr:hypothetical protein DBR20_17340 [Stenotrophomonas sp. HMWF023]PTT36839.1 hypothetical protein DBR33_18940 [Stenotrophomonas sp. HMWF022]
MSGNSSRSSGGAIQAAMWSESLPSWPLNGIRKTTRHFQSSSKQHRSKGRSRSRQVPAPSLNQFRATMPSARL